MVDQHTKNGASQTDRVPQRHGAREFAVYFFGGFELNTGAWELRHGASVLAITTQALNVLAFLIEHRQRVVPRHELLDAIWKDTFVQDGSLTQAIWQIRQALSEQENAWMVKTVRGRGYRFVAPVQSMLKHSTGLHEKHDESPDSLLI